MKNRYTFKFQHGATIVETATGYTMRSVGQRCFVSKNREIWLWNETTDQQMSLEDFLTGRRKFAEFDPVDIFKTRKPTGREIAGWLASLWGTADVYPAMAWVRATVPLDVLLGFGGPLPGVTADAETGWHWSSSMMRAKGPSFFKNRKEFQKYLRSRR